MNPDDSGDGARRDPDPPPRVRGARSWLVLALFLGLVSPLVFSTWYTFHKQREVLEAAFRLELEQTTAVLASGMSEPIWNLTPELGQPLVDSLMNDRRVLGVRVTSLAQGRFLKSRRASAPGAVPIELSQPVVRDDTVIGEVSVQVDPATVTSQLDEHWPEIYALGAMQAALGFGVMLFVYYVLARQQRGRALQEMNRRLSEQVRERAAELREAHDELLRKESLAVLGRLTATVSHELRNPLGTIDASLSVVSRLLERDGGVTGSNRATIEQALERAHRNIGRCSRITDELLGFTQQGGARRQDTEMDHWVAEVIEEFELPAGVTVNAHLDSGVTLEVDRGRLRRALTNVLGNAVQAMSSQDPSQAGGALTVSTAVRNRRLEIRVHDTGHGIAPELREQIFEPLFSTRAFGFGLGLPFVRQVMEQQHGGGIEVVDTDSGAELLLWLPLADAGQPEGPA